MSKKIYLGFYIASLSVFLASWLMLGGANVQQKSFAGSHFQAIGTEPKIGFLGALAFGQLFAVQIVLTLALIYRMWASIEDGRARMTPRRAIALLFVPFFNLYWVFQVWSGFPVDYNRYVDRYELDLPALSRGIYVAYPILLLLSAVPVLGIFAASVGVLVFAAVIWKTCDAVNLLNQIARQRYEAVSRISISNPAAI